MYDKQIVTVAMCCVSAARARLVQRHPFFGKLLLRLRYRFAPCGTACTDMENIIFDIDFLGKLSDSELEFVLLHEVMHCVLQHCLRGKGKINLIYNIACDIVVNYFSLKLSATLILRFTEKTRCTSRPTKLRAGIIPPTRFTKCSCKTRISPSSRLV